MASPKADQPLLPVTDLEKGDAAQEEKNKKKEEKIPTVGRLLSQLQSREWSLLGVATIGLLFSSASALYVPHAFGKLINQLGNGGTRADLNQLLIRLGVILVIGAIATFLRAFLYTLVGQMLVARLRKRLFDHLLGLEVGFYDKNTTGELTNRLAADCTVLSDALTVSVSMFLRQTVQVIASVVLLILISPSLTGIALAIVPATVIVGVFYGKWVKRISKACQQALAEATSAATESFGAIRTVKGFSQETRASVAYGTAVDESYRLGFKKSAAYGGFAFVVGLSVNFAILAVLYFGGRRCLDGDLTPGDLTSFILYVISAGANLAGLSSLFGKLMNAVGASTRIFNLMDRDPVVSAPPPDATLTPAQMKGRVEFRDVKFAYPTRPDINSLADVSFRVEPGQTVALVGHSGAGKSSIVALLQRFYDPQVGTVEIDGRDLRTFPFEYLHRNVVVIQQDPSLFATTIYANIAFGLPEGQATAYDVTAAAKAANAHDFIMEFPKGYQTLVGERGVTLSGGQRQRVAIARALLLKPQVLICDEATSSLDAHSEHLVQSAIDQATAARTCIIIAHRLSTIRNADQVFVVDSGRIVETGTHDSLLASDGVYASLVRRQLFGTGPSSSSVSGSEDDRGDDASVVESKSDP